MSLQLFIGQPKLNGAIGKYASRYNLLELRADQEHLPRENVLRRWAEEVSERFVFSMLLTPSLLRAESEPNSALNRALLAAQALRAKWIVAQTDPMWGPSQKTKQRLTALLKKLLDAGMSVGWEPHGVWQDDEAFSFARDLGVHYVRDVGRGDPLGEDVIYSRMPSLGIAARMSIGTMERVARNVGNASEAYIVVAGEGGRKLQQLLPDLISAQQRGSSALLGGSSRVETFGGFPMPASSAAEEFGEFDEEEVESEDLDEESEDQNDEQAEYDSELDDDEGEDDEGEDDEDEDDEDEDDEDELTDADGDATPPDSKWGHDKKKRKERNRR